MTCEIENSQKCPYVDPLTALELAFRTSGMDVRFELFTKWDTKMVCVEIVVDDVMQGWLSIDGDSPAQAVKDVAEAVSL